ncbi:uncharacterized protein N0V89_007337 [Didymosphaeria variabile]|uniref:Uncharacterized protein n=1 Tax=Didymosphaeria variabile TaxID=1932322 RepID=A0A9W8XJW2_9PLEO|nr:uncharacterized protein N0V89_007337 [Didymosphaeria variabile]KAJ4351991.1 hypothetical protein N0V89_007337 [Didymosphaeria variabile]
MPRHMSPLDNDSSINHVTHLSGMTLADFTTQEPQLHLVEASSSSSKQPLQSPSTMNLTSKRSSRVSASTTKSQLRQTNSILVGMLQDIQNELVTHRAILLNIQNRVSTLEDESIASANKDGPQTTLRAPEGHDAPSKHNSKLLAPEASHWWQACKNFASNAEPPISAREFLKTPQRLSSFDLTWDAPNNPPLAPPDIDDIPPLSPASDKSDDSELVSPIGQNVFLGELSALGPNIAGPSGEVDVNIIERTVESDMKKFPAPPALQPAPGAKSAVVENEDLVAAIEPKLVGNSQQYFKGLKSLATYRALLKHKPSEKEHHVLIHFHRRKDVDHLRAA